MLKTKSFRVLATLTLVVAIALSLLASAGVFNRQQKTASVEAATATATTSEPTAAEKAAAEKAAADKAADDNVRKIVPAEVDQTEVQEFYKQFKDGLLMRNTWASQAEAKKQNTEVLLKNGLYGAVEFPVDIALKSTNSNYVLDHEGAYTEAELQTIKAWIDAKLKGKATDEEKEFLIDWTVERIARDPIYGHMWASALAELHSLSGKTIRELYPWLDNFLIQWDNGNRLESYTCRYADKDGNVQEGIYVSEDYKDIGYKLCTTFVRLTVVNISKPTARHWYMNKLSQLPSETTTEKADFFESEAAAVLAALDKNGTNVFKEKLAINLYDGRAEIVVPVRKKTPVNPDPPKPTPTPKPKPKPTPTPEPTPDPEPTPTPTPDPDPDPEPKKDPADDPVNQGNAPVGGGDNKPDDGPGEYQPKDPRKENPTGDDNDNNHGHSDPGTVTPPTPPVVPEHKDDGKTPGTLPVVIPEGGEQKMDYEPDPVTDRGPADGSNPDPVGEYNDSSYELPDDI